MPNPSAFSEKLKDPAYLDLHLVAVSALDYASSVDWYDAVFLHRLEAAKYFLRQVRPELLDDFVAGFGPLLAQKSFETRQFDNVFDDATHQRIVEITKMIPRDQGVGPEFEQFGRHIDRNHPYFLELQEEVRPLVSEAVGRELVSGYNFLSLYGGEGKCDPHMDQPLSMYTFDYCIEQSHDWPIYVSPVVDWPTVESMKGLSPAALSRDPGLPFEELILKPNQAIIFNGSSQWHYRNAIAPGGFCNLLFFHFYPEGTDNLVRPRKWAEHFGIAELQPLCDLFAADGIEETGV